MAYSFANSYVTILQAAVSTAVSYVSSLTSETTYQEALLYSELQATTIYNALAATEALQMRRGLVQLYTNLEYLVAASLDLTAAQQTAIVNRISAIQAAALAIESISSSAYDASIKFPSGQPAVTDPGYLLWLFDWSYETAPDGLTAGTLLAQATADVEAWQSLYDSTPGSSIPGVTVDAVGLILGAATQNLASLGRLSVENTDDTQALWNAMVSAPILTQAAESIVSDPTSSGYQSLRCLRYSWMYLYFQANQVIFNLRDSTPSKVRTEIVKQGDTIMSFAARTLGNFERFTEVIALNSLVPPYISTSRAANVVIPGDRLFIPTSTSSSTVAKPQDTFSAPDYLTGVLGVDVYYGPPNVDMLSWTGDFQTISGYANLSLSLGRRLRTPLGSLEPHPEYGSRIPGELGAIQSSSTSGHLSAYAKAAILSDPRVDRVTQIVVSYSGNFSVVLKAFAMPVGPGNSTASVSVAETVTSS